MEIEQIGLFVVGWFAVGFIVALGLGKILREANYLDRLDVGPRAATRIPASTPVSHTTYHRPAGNKTTQRANSDIGPT